MLAWLGVLGVGLSLPAFGHVFISLKDDCICVARRGGLGSGSAGAERSGRVAECPRCVPCKPLITLARVPGGTHNGTQAKGERYQQLSGKKPPIVAVKSASRAR